MALCCPRPPRSIVPARSNLGWVSNALQLFTSFLRSHGRHLDSRARPMSPHGQYVLTAELAATKDHTSRSARMLFHPLYKVLAIISTSSLTFSNRQTPSTRTTYSQGGRQIYNTKAMCRVTCVSSHAPARKSSGGKALDLWPPSDNSIVCDTSVRCCFVGSERLRMYRAGDDFKPSREFYLPRHVEKRFRTRQQRQ